MTAENILQTYERIYNEYKDICKECQAEYHSDPTSNVMAYCIMTDLLRNKLLGMQDFLRELNLIDSKREELELKKTIDYFSTEKLFHCFIEEGELIILDRNDEES